MFHVGDKCSARNSQDMSCFPYHANRNIASTNLACSGEEVKTPSKVTEGGTTATFVNSSVLKKQK